MDPAAETRSGDELAEMPTFELEWRYDDPSDPAELTVYDPEADRLATEWVTVDRSTAVSFDRIR